MEFLDVARAFAALILVLGLFMVVAMAARRWFPQWQNRLSDGSRRLEVIESRPIDARNRLVLVRCDDREHLLVVGAQGVTPLSDKAVDPSRPSPTDRKQT